MDYCGHDVQRSFREKERFEPSAGTASVVGGGLSPFAKLTLATLLIMCYNKVGK